MAHTTKGDDGGVRSQGGDSPWPGLQKGAMLVGIALPMGLYLAVAAGVPSDEVLALAVPVAALGIVAGVVSWLQMTV